MHVGGKRFFFRLGGGFVALSLAILTTSAIGQEVRQNRLSDPAANLLLDVYVSCKDGVLNFQVENEGAEWPALANVAVYRTDTQQPITQRRLKFAEKQKATFRVRDAGDSEYGLWIDTPWQQRPFGFDVRARCEP